MMKKKPVFQEGQALQNEDSATLKLLVSLTAVQISDLMLSEIFRSPVFTVEILCCSNSVEACSAT